MISDKQVTSKQKYKNLKRKLKLLLYEQECFLDELRKSERKMIKVQRDKNFLLDRLLQFERVEDSSGDSDSTMSSGESDSEIPALSQASRSGSAARQERGSPATATVGFSGQFPFGQSSTDHSSSSSMLSSSLPGMYFMHQQQAPTSNGPGATAKLLVAGTSASSGRSRGRPRGGAPRGAGAGAGGGRGVRGRGGPGGLSSGVIGGVGTPSRGSSSNGTYPLSQQQQQMPGQYVPPPLGSPQPPGSGGSSMLPSGELSSPVPFQMHSDNNFMHYPPPQQGQQPQQSQQQRFTPQPGSGLPGNAQQLQSQSQPPPASMMSTGQPPQNNIMLSQQPYPGNMGQQPPQMSQNQQNKLQPSASQQQQQQQALGMMGPPAQMQPPAMGGQLSNEISLITGDMTQDDVERFLESDARPDRFLYERIPEGLPADIFSDNSTEDGGVGGIGNSVSSEA